jgi:hypothetical protein
MRTIATSASAYGGALVGFRAARLISSMETFLTEDYRNNFGIPPPERLLPVFSAFLSVGLA